MIFALTESGAYQPLDPEPNPAGNVLAFRDGMGTWRARSVAALDQDGGSRHPLEKTYMPHFATCKGPAQQELPANVTPIRRAT
ncbi:hypothetical protein [Actinomadura madurae]|uniref:hypothetical protein n=1 Tax=Actinomadura madurae TaxID=1993 RepID=UPI0020D22C55|nr:hypothetical protein [Actinomadura madurae]MCP9947193.1 hypothetical protein [Actinomadura madurae]MCP9963959.1 hypothetical protein [Actinomadura madurae]MCP9976433.1 hypothetical protein [Actinomadura madurae]MCQ0012074.1 hypothetical protein [Actinomadura madurae]MCQ0012626.1 hypothetical protein [Actinomadura madurae]